MFRYLALGLVGLAITLSAACSSTTNVTGVAIPTRNAADALPPTDGSDVMNVLPPTDGSDVMNAKGTSDALPPTDGSDVMNVLPPTDGSDVMNAPPKP